MEKEHERLLQQGWALGADGCYRKPTFAQRYKAALERLKEADAEWKADKSQESTMRRAKALEVIGEVIRESQKG